MNDAAATFNAAARALQESARAHKQSAQRHKRAGHDDMARLDEIRALAATFGITLEIDDEDQEVKVNDRTHSRTLDPRAEARQSQADLG
jgi:hypothetical protein